MVYLVNSLYLSVAWPVSPWRAAVRSARKVTLPPTHPHLSGRIQLTTAAAAAAGRYYLALGFIWYHM